jgi:hypothetical protein
MADTYTSSLRIAQQTVGGNENTWGTILNSSLAMLDAAIAGIAFVSVTAGNVTLSASNNADDQARLPLIVPTGSPGTTRTITAPNVEKLTWVYNSTADGSAITWSAGGGATVTIPSGNVAMIFSDGATNAAALLNMNATVSGQIKFPAAQNASADANTLDDYEEGTFTPTLGDGTNNFTLTSQTGLYTKVGNLVFIAVGIIWSSIGSAGTSSLRVGALPFTVNNSVKHGGHLAGGSGLDVTASGKQIVAECQGGNEIRFAYVEDNATFTPLPANSCSATGSLGLSITYRE